MFKRDLARGQRQEAAEVDPKKKKLQRQRKNQTSRHRKRAGLKTSVKTTRDCFHAAGNPSSESTHFNALSLFEAYRAIMNPSSDTKMLVVLVKSDEIIGCSGPGIFDEDHP